MTTVVVLLLGSFINIEKYTKIKARPPVSGTHQSGFFAKKSTQILTQKKI